VCGLVQILDHFLYPSTSGEENTKAIQTKFPAWIFKFAVVNSEETGNSDQKISVETCRETKVAMSSYCINSSVQRL
jgi:hypothetical protein